MSILAEGNITLTAVNDASSVLLTPGSCMIKADYDGSNPVLTNAYGDISLIRGENKVSLAGATVTVQSTSDPGITAQILNIDAYTKRVKITALATTILSGNIVVSVVTASLSATVTFQFSIIREATMLDWIQDWETNKTSISGGYILTPKIYAGAIDSEGKLTGVYMGPDTNGAGLYGYRGGDEVFHLNATGAMLGGWNLNTGGISSSDGKMKILSEGTIAAYDANDNVVWGLYKTGAASFAKGNVLFNADGSASFTGSITSESGTIGGWGITSRALWKNHVMLDASRNYIGISKTAISAANAADSNYANRDTVHSGGGVCMFYTSDNGYGLEGYLSSGTAIFQLGSTNQIANWTLKANSLASDYVVLSNLGTNAGIFLSTSSMANSALTGLATTIQGGTGIYIQATASAVDMAGYISGSLRFRVGTVQNYIAGWSFDASSLRNRYISISNDSSNSGIYFTTSDTSANTIAQLPGQIQGGTGIYIKSGASSVELAGYSGGSAVFKIGTGGNLIAGWTFNASAIYTGSATITSGFAAANALVLSTAGLYSNKWNILVDGSAKFAGGKVSFAADGSGALAGGKISWAYSNNKTTLNIGSVMLIDDDITADGMVLSKSIMVRNSAGSVMAGITADGTSNDSVRFWAGGTFANRASASTKFRVTQGGKLFASDAEISGTISATSGTMTDLTIKRTKNPFTYLDPAISLDDGISASEFVDDDTTYTDLSGGWTVYNHKYLPCDVNQSGRRIINVGSVELAVPPNSGCYIYINGKQYTSVELINEIVELIGFGTATTFYGWILISRSYYKTAYSYGRAMHPLACGKVTGSSGGVSLSFSKTFDGSTLYVSREEAGSYTLYVPKAWFAYSYHIYCALTGMKISNGVSCIKACIESISETTHPTGGSVWAIEISTADDDSRNEGAFQFMIYNLNEW